MRLQRRKIFYENVPKARGHDPHAVQKLLLGEVNCVCLVGNIVKGLEGDVHRLTLCAVGILLPGECAVGVLCLPCEYIVGIVRSHKSAVLVDDARKNDRTVNSRSHFGHIGQGLHNYSVGEEYLNHVAVPFGSNVQVSVGNVKALGLFAVDLHHRFTLAHAGILKATVNFSGEAVFTMNFSSHLDI